MNKEEFQKQYPELKKDLFNLKKFKKSISSKFDQYINILRIRITNKHNKFDEISKSIIHVVNDILDKESTFESGNVYFVLIVLSNHLDYLKERSVLCNQEHISRETLEEQHNEIIDQHESVRDALIENLKTPYNYDTLPDALGINLNSGENNGK